MPQISHQNEPEAKSGEKTEHIALTKDCQLTV